MSNLSEQAFVLSESSLFAIVACIVLFKERTTPNASDLLIHSTNTIDELSLNVQKVRIGSDLLHSLSVMGIFTASVIAFLVMVLRMRLYKRNHSKIDKSNTPSGELSNDASLGTPLSIDLVKDDIGISFGSSLAGLVFFCIYRKMEQHVSKDSDSLEQMRDILVVQLYTVLLGCVGLSFAVSCFILTVQENRDEKLLSRSMMSIKLQPNTSSKMRKRRISLLNRKISDNARILQKVIVIFPVMVSYVIYRTLQENDAKKNGGEDTIANSENVDYNECIFAAWRRCQIHLSVGCASIESALLIYYCYGSQRTHQGEQASQSLPGTISPSSDRNSLQEVFSFGEWVIVSSFGSILSTDYVMRYIHNNMADGECPIQTFTPADGLSSEIVVAQSGLFGCILGVCVGSFIISKWMSRNKGSSGNNAIVHCATQLTATVFVTFASLQVALARYCVETKDDLAAEWCPSPNESLLRGILIPFQWITIFLMRNDIIKGNRTFVLSDNHTQLPRYAWLIYWVLILLISLPIAMYLARKLRSLSDDGLKKKFTTVSRKFFHFVAVALFTPVTAFSPKLMYLSYAIAAALLILVESLRSILHSSNTDGFVKEVLDTKKTKENEDGQKHNALVNGHQTLNLNEFFETFYDEKDKKALEGSFVVTHVALVIGCALPLWLDCIRGGPNSMQDASITPFLGIISLGIGDAAGAIIGSMFGKTKWPASRRTLEGSSAMLVSMITCGLIYIWVFQLSTASFHKDAMLIYFPLTILEASTLQIDNICLPMAAFVLSSTTI